MNDNINEELNNSNLDSSKDCGCGNANNDCQDNCTSAEENLNGDLNSGNEGEKPNNTGNCNCKNDEKVEEKEDYSCEGDDSTCTEEENLGCDSRNDSQESCECNENECNCKRADEVGNEEENPNYFDTLIKLQAEFDNYRKRTEADTSKAYKNGFIDAVTDFLPALDSFKMATEYITDKNTLIGIEYIEKGILNTLEKMGVKVIDATGKFDPNFHQAIDTDTTADVESGYIVKECYKGFIMGDKVIRYSQVIVKK